MRLAIGSIMATAKNALEELSLDPKAQIIARERELAVWNMQHMLHASRKEGREEGREEGRGVALSAIDAICSILGIEIDEAKNAQLRALDLRQLNAFVTTLKSERRWPECTELQRSI